MPMYYGPSILINTDIKLTGGGVHDLATVKKLTVQYDYSQMAVGKYATEDEYLSNIRKKYRPKKAKKIIGQWKAGRSVFESRFKAYFFYHAQQIGLAGTNSKDSIATLVVKTIKAEPDYQGATWSNPYVTINCIFLDSAGTFLLSYSITAYGSRGKNPVVRLTECYQNAGIMLGKNIVKRLRKASHNKDKYNGAEE
jgi:hypothetical protein